MKTFVLLALALAALLVATSARSQNAADVRPQFIARLQTLADSTDLFDPTAVATVLGIGLHTGSTDRSNSCHDSSELSHIETVEAIPNAAWWYHVLPTGVRDMPIPAVFINPATTASDAGFSYKIERHHDCPEMAIRNNTEAALNFSGLPSFACISVNDLQRLLPSAKEVMATDGYFSYDYQGREDDKASTSLRFSFRMGAPCALDASITKSDAWSWRSQRVRLRYERCEVEVKHRFCAAHPSVAWGSPDSHRLSDAMEAACGNLAAAYANEPASGNRPDWPAIPLDTSPVCDTIIRN